MSRPIANFYRRKKENRKKKRIYSLVISDYFLDGLRDFNSFGEPCFVTSLSEEAVGPLYRPCTLPHFSFPFFLAHSKIHFCTISFSFLFVPQNRPLQRLSLLSPLRASSYCRDLSVSPSCSSACSSVFFLLSQSH